MGLILLPLNEAAFGAKFIPPTANCVRRLISINGIPANKAIIKIISNLIQACVEGYKVVLCFLFEIISPIRSFWHRYLRIKRNIINPTNRSEYEHFTGL